MSPVINNRCLIFRLREADKDDGKRALAAAVKAVRQISA
jgi:hypothetical protein